MKDASSTTHEPRKIKICPGLSSGREQRRTHERFVLVGGGGIDLVRVRVWVSASVVRVSARISGQDQGPG